LLNNGVILLLNLELRITVIDLVRFKHPTATFILIMDPLVIQRVVCFKGILGDTQNKVHVRASQERQMISFELIVLLDSWDFGRHSLVHVYIDNAVIATAHHVNRDGVN